MSKSERGDARQVPSDVLILAAVRRAALHRAKAPAEAPAMAVLAHLEVGRRSRAARHVAARLAALRDAGELGCEPRHGIAMWRLTAAGSRRLERARRLGTPPALGESPQHREWRNARTAALQEIDRFRAQLRLALREAQGLLTAAPATGSDAWFELGRMLERRCWLVGSATHCLTEWPEPHDDRADRDLRESPVQARSHSLRHGRRNLRLWREPP